MPSSFPAETAYYRNSARIARARRAMNGTYGPRYRQIVRIHQRLCDRVATLYPVLIAENGKRLAAQLAGR